MVIVYWIIGALLWRLCYLIYKDTESGKSFGNYIVNSLSLIGLWIIPTILYNCVYPDLKILIEGIF